jgi:glucose-1-phosphate cytidylyltransferase
MKYFAHYGHKEFILCLGYRGDMIKEYFLQYNPYISENLVIDRGGKLSPERSDIADWRIHLVDTGMNTNIGGRLMAVRDYLGDDEMFLASYGDQLTDLPLDQHIQKIQKTGAVAGFVAVHPTQQSYHTARLGADGLVTEIVSMADSGLWINGGYMVLRKEIFDYMEPGDELVEAPFRRLVADKKLAAFEYRGFWHAMDTFKDKMMFDRMFERGETPWEVWRWRSRLSVPAPS